MEYKVIQGNDTEKFSREVTEHLQNGWRLHGSVSNTYVRFDGTWLAQALVKGGQ